MGALVRLVFGTVVEVSSDWLLLVFFFVLVFENKGKPIHLGGENGNSKANALSSEDQVGISVAGVTGYCLSQIPQGTILIGIKMVRIHKLQVSLRIIDAWYHFEHEITC